MPDGSGLRALMDAAVMGAGSATEAAEQLCAACVAGLDVDGASIVVIRAGAAQGAVGASGELVRHVDDLQFTFGEGPCLESVCSGNPVLVTDFDDPAEQRWLALAGEALAVGVHAVFALPVGADPQPGAQTRAQPGALDLVRRRGGPLTGAELAGALVAAELAAVPLSHLVGRDPAGGSASGGGADPVEGGEQSASLERIEVYQATGMVVAALGVGSAEAPLRLRGHAIARGMTASELSWEIIERRLLPDAHEWRRSPRSLPGRAPRPR